MALFIEHLTNFIFVDSLVCVGSDDYNLVRKKSWFKKNIVLIKNGVAAPNAKTDIEIEKIRAQNDFLVLTICRLHYQKDIETLIKSFSSLTEKAILVIIGDGPQRRSLEAIAGKNKDKIIFLGNKENASSLIHYFDVFVLATHWEGLPLVILEAMLANVITVGSDVHGVRELIKNNETGFLFKEGDVSALSDKIKEAFYDTEKCRRLAKKAFLIAEEEYSIVNMIRGYKKTYNE
jgi:glycosyltransferase involved in cell wall biosynthesis